MFNDFTTQANTVITALATKFSDYLTAWFPDEKTTYAAAEAYLLDAISNTTSGAIPEAIKAAIIESGRVEIVASAARATEEATTRYAAMRHPPPPGALAGATLRIAQGSLDSEAALIRSIAQKDFELAYQRGMDAVQKALANRQTALSAAKGLHRIACRFRVRRGRQDHRSGARGTHDDDRRGWRLAQVPGGRVGPDAALVDR